MTTRDELTAKQALKVRSTCRDSGGAHLVGSSTRECATCNRERRRAERRTAIKLRAEVGEEVYSRILLEELERVASESR